MSPKYQVFVSSTYKDLKDERWEAMRALLSMECIVSGMEMFPAIDLDQFEYIKQAIDDCDYYLLILAGKYGTINPDTGLSYTEMEYDYAISKGIKVIALPHQNFENLSPDKRETDPTVLQKFIAFRERVVTGRLVRFWEDKNQIETLVMQSIFHATRKFPAVGWVRASAVANEEALADLNKLRKVNDELRHEIETLRQRVEPKISNLAPLNEDFVLSCSTSQDKTIDTFTTSWKEIFMYLYNHFRDGVAAHSINSILTRKYFPMKIVDKRSLGDISHECLNIVINQFIAHNLIENRPSMGKWLYPVYYLTELGLKYGLEGNAIKASSIDTTN